MLAMTNLHFVNQLSFGRCIGIRALKVSSICASVATGTISILGARADASVIANVAIGAVIAGRTAAGAGAGAAAGAAAAAAAAVAIFISMLLEISRS